MRLHLRAFVPLLLASLAACGGGGGGSASSVSSLSGELTLPVTARMAARAP